MGLNAKNKEYANNGDRVEQEVMEAGTYPARLVQVIDLGVQEQQAFDGKEKPPAQEIMTTYEFVDEFLKDKEGNDVEDKPRWLSENFVLYNLQSELAKSTKRYFAIDPQGEEDGDWTKLAGYPVMVTIGVSTIKSGKNKGKKVNKILSTSTARPKEAAKFPDLKNPAKVFSIDDLDTADVYASLPQWLQDKIKNSLEFEGSDMDKALKGGKGAAKEEKKAEPKKKAAVKDEDDDVPSDMNEAAKDAAAARDEEEDWG